MSFPNHIMSIVCALAAAARDRRTNAMIEAVQRLPNTSLIEAILDLRGTWACYRALLG